MQNFVLSFNSKLKKKNGHFVKLKKCVAPLLECEYPNRHLSLSNFGNLSQDHIVREVILNPQRTERIKKNTKKKTI